MKFKFLVALLAFALPWKLKRWLLIKLLGYSLHPTARIGFSLVFPSHLVMMAHSSIDHLTICKGLALVQIGENSGIGRLNWITGEPLNSRFFSKNTDRKAELILEEHAFITNRHIIDCTDQVVLGRFSLIAGYHSQILTHSINLKDGCQSCKSITIGEYCFVGTNSILLPGAKLPNFSVLGASSVLTKPFLKEYMLYGGIPTQPIKELSPDLKYFHRLRGEVE